jgi:hypothetical protein
MLVAAGCLAILLLVWHPIDLLPFRILLFVLAFFAIQFTTVFLHELGHLAAAVMFRLLPAALVVGSGPKLAEFKLGKVAFQFRSSTNEGCVVPTYARHPNSRLVFLGLFAAGPLVDMLVLLVFLRFLIFPPDSLSENVLYEPQIQPVLLIASAYLFFYQIAYLFRYQSYREGHYTDARGIADAFKYVPLAPNVEDASKRLCERFFKSENFPTDPLTADAQDLRTYVEWALSFGSPTRDQVRYFKDLFVTATILYGWKDHLPLADAYSADLLANDPNEITFKGSRGSVLVDLGKFDEGKPLLQEVFSISKSEVDRVISAAFIAIAEHNLGHPESAANWLKEATSINPSSPATQRARGVLRI